MLPAKKIIIPAILLLSSPLTQIFGMLARAPGLKPGTSSPNRHTIYSTTKQTFHKLPKNIYNLNFQPTEKLFKLPSSNTKTLFENKQELLKEKSFQESERYTNTRIIKPFQKYFFTQHSQESTESHDNVKNIEPKTTKSPNAISESIAPSKEFQISIKTLNNELFDAVKEENIEKVQEILQQGANPLCKDDFGLTPVNRAVISGNQTLIKTLTSNESCKDSLKSLCRQQNQSNQSPLSSNSRQLANDIGRLIKKLLPLARNLNMSQHLFESTDKKEMLDFIDSLEKKCLEKKDPDTQENILLQKIKYLKNRFNKLFSDIDNQDALSDAPPQQQTDLSDKLKQVKDIAAEEILTEALKSTLSKIMKSLCIPYSPPKLPASFSAISDSDQLLQPQSEKTEKNQVNEVIKWDKKE